MLVQYTSLSSLSEAEKQQLKSIVSRIVLEGRKYIDFNGKYLAVHDLLVQKRIWENEARGVNQQPLFG